MTTSEMVAVAERRKKRRSDVKRRLVDASHEASYCRIHGCTHRTTSETGKGLNRLYCRPHEEFFERHGSHNHRSYSAADIAPHRRAAMRWLKEHQGEAHVVRAMRGIQSLYTAGGPLRTAFRLSGLSPAERSREAWARLREAQIAPVKPLAAWLAIEATIRANVQRDHRSEFKRVQAAKVVHRLASGSHKRWERTGKAALEMHKYPASRGRVLRHIGEQLEQAAEFITEPFLEWHHRGTSGKPRSSTRNNNRKPV